MSEDGSPGQTTKIAAGCVVGVMVAVIVIAIVAAVLFAAWPD